MIFRRYFFDLEKIAAIYQFSVKPDTIISPLEGLFQISTAPWPDDNIHYFIAEHIFGMPGNGVPPSILGEIILILGPIYVIPVTLLTTILILAAEKYMMRTRKGAHKIFMVLLLSKAYFLLPNSDMLSTIRRIVFDTGLFYGGLVTYYLLIGYFQRVQPPSGGASRGNTPESRGLL